MTRRDWLGCCGMAVAARAQQAPIRESVTASATVDRTPQIGIVRSDLKKGEEEDGTPFEGLAQPRPVDARLTSLQLTQMVRKAIGFGGIRRGGLGTRTAPNDWVVVLAGAGADPRISAAVVAYLAEKRRGKRFTILGEGRVAGAESVPLNQAERIELPVPDRYPRSFAIPKIVQECDTLIVNAPLDRLAIGSYSALAPGQVDAEGLLDLFQFHVANYAVVSGTAQGCNVMFAGVNAVCVDAIAGAARGRPAAYLEMVRKRGWGETDPDSIWTRGNTVEEAKKALAAMEIRTRSSVHGRERSGV
jgi:hypothetical protein